MVHKKQHKVEFPIGGNATGIRFCTSCQTKQELKGGEFCTFNYGRNQRWICVSCKDRRSARLACIQ